MIVDVEKHTITFTAKEMDRIGELVTELYSDGWNGGYHTGTKYEWAKKRSRESAIRIAKSLAFFGIKARHPHLTEYEGFKPDGC